jgi:uncharacterized protein YciI
MQMCIELRRGFMKLQSPWVIRTLCCLSLAGATAASAQTPTSRSTSESYIIKLKAPQLDSADEAAMRRRNTVPAAVYWDNLYNVGKVALLGSARDGDSTYRVVILEGVNADEARTIARNDPNVMAGAVTAEIIPLRVDLTQNGPIRGVADRR